MKINSMIFFSILFFLSACSLSRQTQSKLYLQALENKPYDVIIVPGIPYNGKEWNTTMKDRIIWSVFLLKKGIAKNIIFSGGSVYTPFVEAKVMALYAEALGISKENIFMETQAQHSTENIYYSYQLATKMGFKSIALASDPIQSSLLMRFTKRTFNTPISYIPFVVDSLVVISSVAPKINLDSAKVENFKSILITQSKWKRFRGTCGKNINYEME